MPIQIKSLTAAGDSMYEELGGLLNEGDLNVACLF